MEELTGFLSGLPLEDLARQTKFCRRTARKLTPLLFLQTALLLLSQRVVSLTRWAVLAGLLGGLTLSKQAFWERLNASAVHFLQAVLGLALAKKSSSPSAELSQALNSFPRVLVQDSTTVRVSEKLDAFYPGARNQRDSKPGQLKIQCLYSLLQQRFVSFSLSGFRRNDQAAAGDVLAILRQGDLVLRDLGYFVLSSFEQIAQAGAFFLSRLRTDTNVWDARQDKPLDLLRLLRRHGGNLDRTIRLGQKEKLPVRLVAIRLPAAVAAERRRKALANRDKRCKPNPKRLALLDWALFITNVPASRWSTKTVAQVYGLRWRIETIFKAWKSHFHLEEVPDGSVHQLETMIYARLIFITIFAHLCGEGWKKVAADQRESPYSLLKLASLVASFWFVLFVEACGIKVTDGWLEQILYHARYEKRRRQNYVEILMKLS